MPLKKFPQLLRFILNIFFKYFLQYTVTFFVILQYGLKNKVQQGTKHVLLVRLDAIGDYILFRNFIEVLKKHPKYCDYKITLLGNAVWKDLAESLDKEYITNFIWVDVKKFSSNLLYRYRKLVEITSINCELLIHSTYSRTYDADNIVKLVNAKIKIASIGNLSNIKKWQKRISDKYYNQLIPARNGIIFEFYRNKEFFEKLLGEEIKIPRPHINISENNFPLKLPKSNYSVLFISASSEFKKWNIENFAQVAKWIKNNLTYEIVLCGGKEDIKKVSVFERIYKNSYLNLVGKTSLTDLVFILKNSKMLVSNETFIVHMAVALGMRNTFVIYNGSHFGRFIPYPLEITTSYFPVYHPEIKKNLEKYESLSNTYRYRSKLDINEIPADDVINKINLVTKF